MALESSGTILYVAKMYQSDNWFGNCQRVRKKFYADRPFLVLFLHFCRKTRLIKQASVCLCVYLCVCVSLSLCVCVCVCLFKILAPPNNFQTSYPIDTKFWLHIVSYRNYPTPLTPFLNSENCAREKFLKFIFLHLINMGKFSNSYYASDI